MTAAGGWLGLAYTLAMTDAGGWLGLAYTLAVRERRVENREEREGGGGAH